MTVKGPPTVSLVSKKHSQAVVNLPKTTTKCYSQSEGRSGALCQLRARAQHVYQWETCLILRCWTKQQIMMAANTKLLQTA